MKDYSMDTDHSRVGVPFDWPRINEGEVSSSSIDNSFLHNHRLAKVRLELS